MLESKKLQLWTPVKLQSKRLDCWFDATDNTTFVYDKNTIIFIVNDKSGNNQHFLQKIFAFFRKAATNLMAIFKNLQL